MYRKQEVGAGFGLNCGAGVRWNLNERRIGILTSAVSVMG